MNIVTLFLGNQRGCHHRGRPVPVPPDPDDRGAGRYRLHVLHHRRPVDGQKSCTRCPGAESIPHRLCGRVRRSHGGPRVQDVGREANPNNFLLMHAMGPNVAGVIGSANCGGLPAGRIRLKANSVASPFTRKTPASNWKREFFQNERFARNIRFLSCFRLLL